MTHNRWSFMLAFACVVALSSGAAAQESPPTPEEMAKLQKIMMEAAVPGPEHERLAALEGSWTVSGKIWPQPGAEPMEFSGTSRSRMVLGGRFLVSETESGEGPMASSSMTVFGFDRRSGEYTIVGFDTWGTYWVSAAGRVRESDGAIVMHGKDTVPGTNHTQVYEFILRKIDADTHMFEIVFSDAAHTRGGPPFKMVEITYRRSGDQ